MEHELGVVLLCKSIERQDLLALILTGSFHIAIAPANFCDLDTAAVP